MAFILWATTTTTTTNNNNLLITYSRIGECFPAEIERSEKFDDDDNNNIITIIMYLTAPGMVSWMS
jgi:hypothetical protein